MENTSRKSTQEPGYFDDGRGYRFLIRLPFAVLAVVGVMFLVVWLFNNDFFDNMTAPLVTAGVGVVFAVLGTGWMLITEYSEEQAENRRERKRNKLSREDSQES